MANALYPAFKNAYLTNTTPVDFDADDIRAILVDLADYSYDANHDFLDDVPAAARVAVAAMSGLSVTDNVVDANDTTFTAVTGDGYEAIILYKHTGTESTSRLIAYIDTGVTGLPATPSGGNVTIQWDNGANKIFAL